MVARGQVKRTLIAALVGVGLLGLCLTKMAEPEKAPSATFLAPRTILHAEKNSQLDFNYTESLNKLNEELAYYKHALDKKNARLAQLISHYKNQSSTLSTSNHIIPMESHSLMMQNQDVFPEPSYKSGSINMYSKLVIGIPTVYRPNGSYLVPTLESIFESMPKGDMQKCTIIIMVAEPDKPAFVKAVGGMLLEKFPNQTNTFMQVIVPPPKFYPDLDHLPKRWGDPPFRAKWRTKQNLDYSYLMHYCASLGTYYLQLEDDIITKPNFVSTIINVADSTKDWELIRFSELGFIGKLFRTAQLRGVYSFFHLFAVYKPVDWLLEDYYRTMHCHLKKCSNGLKASTKVHKPSLFQHMGLHSSLPGKIQKLKDKGFAKGKQERRDAIPVMKFHTDGYKKNPAASYHVTLKQYGNYAFSTFYAQGTTVFWAKTPVDKDHIRLIFTEPVWLHRFKIVSGDFHHKNDRLEDATVEVSLANSEDTSLIPKNYTRTKDNYVIIGSFKDTRIDTHLFSVAEGSLPATFGEVKSFQIVCHSDSKNWAILSSMRLETYSGKHP